VSLLCDIMAKLPSIRDLGFHVRFVTEVTGTTPTGSSVLRSRQPGLDPQRSAPGSQLLFVNKTDHARLIIDWALAQWIMQGINKR